jgi:hypothetical protein
LYGLSVKDTLAQGAGRKAQGDLGHVASPSFVVRGQQKPQPTLKLIGVDGFDEEKRTLPERYFITSKVDCGKTNDSYPVPAHLL